MFKTTSNESRILVDGLYIEVSGEAIVEQLEKGLTVLRSAHERLMSLQKGVPANTSSGIYVRKLRVDIEARIAQFAFMAEHIQPDEYFSLDREEIAFITGTVIDLEGLNEAELSVTNPPPFSMPPTRE